MARCPNCERKDRQLHTQEVQIANQRAELDAASNRIKRLEAALREICDYAEVCQHSPARPLLVAERQGAAG